MLLLRARITGLRKNIPSDVLKSYETVKRSDPKAFLDPQLFPLMVLLAVIAAWAGQKRILPNFQTKYRVRHFESVVSNGRVFVAMPDMPFSNEKTV